MKSLELEKNGIPDNVSLIVFSAEAKTHKDIARVASKQTLSLPSDSKL